MCELLPDHLHEPFSPGSPFCRTLPPTASHGSASTLQLLTHDDASLFILCLCESYIISLFAIRHAATDNKAPMVNPNNVAVFDPGNIMHTGGWVKEGFRANLQIQIRFLNFG